MESRHAKLTLSRTIRFASRLQLVPQSVTIPWQKRNRSAKTFMSGNVSEIQFIAIEIDL
jgi:hypothetical protein